MTPGRLICSGAPAEALDRPYDPRVMGNIGRRVANNLHYLGNLLALDAWWRHIRVRFTDEPWQRHCHAGALARLTEMFDERMKRIDQFAEKVVPAKPDAALHSSHRTFIAAWPGLREALRAQIAARATSKLPAQVHAILTRTSSGKEGADYLEWVHALAPADRQCLTAWLQGEVNACATRGTV